MKTPDSPRTTAKLFKNGRSQAVRLPKEFRLPGAEVLIRREGNDVILTAMEGTVGEALEEFWKEHPEGLGFGRPPQPAMPPARAL